MRKGYLAAIVGLPANLFYGTSIPACLIVIDKKNAAERKGIFMIDASAGFMKDGAKNRLRDQDIHKIVDVFTKRTDVERYSRMVSLAEIEKNEFNLNLPRYIDSQMPEDIQDIAGHLQGGIPERDIDGLSRYWDVCPGLRTNLFTLRRPGYFDRAVEASAIKSTIYEHPEFATFITDMSAHFETWRVATAAKLKALEPGFHPKVLIGPIADDLLAHYISNPLIDAYSVYQHLMDYWASTMQDDCYIISADGWTARTTRIIEKQKKTNKEKDRGWVCELVPKAVLVAHYYATEQAAIDQLEVDLEAATVRLAELQEEHAGDDGYLDFEVVNRATVSARLKDIGNDKTAREEVAVLKAWLHLNAEETDFKRRIREADADLDAKAYAKYPKLTPSDVKTLVVDDKWFGTLAIALHGDLDRVSQQLAQRVKELGDRYETPASQFGIRVQELEAKVSHHLKRMGFSWL